MINFLFEVYEGIKKNELFATANVLTFRLLMSIFPFIIFIINLTAFFNLDFGGYIARFTASVPKEVIDILYGFAEEMADKKRISLLSSSLIISVYSASSGFLSAVRGLEKAYSMEKSGYIKSRIICMLFVIGFSFILMLSLVIMIFGDRITNFFQGRHIFPAFCFVIANKLTYLLAVFTIFVIISLFYLTGVSVKQRLTDVMAGSVFVVLVWIIASKLFNVYINNFSKYSVIYGSIGGIFIMAYWVYILSAVFLIGGEINAVIYKRKHKTGGNL